MVCGGERGTCRSEEVISGGPDDAQVPLDTPEIGPRRSGPMRNSMTSFPAAFQTRSWKGAPFQLDQNERSGVAEANEGHSAFRHDQEGRTVPRSPTNSPSHAPTGAWPALSIVLSIFCPPVLKLSPIRLTFYRGGQYAIQLYAIKMVQGAVWVPGAQTAAVVHRLGQSLGLRPGAHTPVAKCQPSKQPLLLWKHTFTCALPMASRDRTQPKWQQRC